jgi:hypothetical protein
MADPVIPEKLWCHLKSFVGEIRDGRWSGGAQIVLNVSPSGQVTSLEVKARITEREEIRGGR